MGGGIPPPDRTLPDRSADHVTTTVVVEPVHAGARVGVLHEVTSVTVGGGLGNDLPVTECLDLRLDVADGGSEVTDTESALSLVRGESLAAGEVVDDTTLLGESVVHNTILQFGCFTKGGSLETASMSLDSTLYIIQLIFGMSTHAGYFS